MTNTNPSITQTTIYKTLHIKLKIDQHEPNYHSNNHLQNITQKTKDWPTRTTRSLKQPSTKHYTENKRLTNTNPTITQTTIYKTLHRKLKIDQHEPNYHSNNHLQNTTQKTKDWPTQTQLSLKQPSTKHYTQKTKDWPTQTPLSLKQPSTKHYTENKRLTNTNPTITQTTIYKTLHRKQKIDQHEPNYHSNNHLQNITQKTKQWPTQTQLSLKQPSTKHYTVKQKIDQHEPNYHSNNLSTKQLSHRKQKIDQHEPNYHSNNHLQNTTQKTKDWPTQTQLSLKQPSTKHYTENKRLTNTNPTITQTTIYKTLHRKQKIDQHKPNYHSNNHLQNTTQKTKDWPTRTQLSLKQPSTKHYTEN